MSVFTIREVVVPAATWTLLSPGRSNRVGIQLAAKAALGAACVCQDGEPNGVAPILATNPAIAQRVNLAAAANSVTALVAPNPGYDLWGYIAVGGGTVTVIESNSHN